MYPICKCYVCLVSSMLVLLTNPSILQDIYLIENVRRPFTRKVCILFSIPILSYNECLSLFRLESL